VSPFVLIDAERGIINAATRAGYQAQPKKLLRTLFAIVDSLAVISVSHEWLTLMVSRVRQWDGLNIKSWQPSDSRFP